MNAIACSLKFFLKNISDARAYRVLEEEQERLNTILQNRSQRDNTSFFCFDTTDGLSVCISIKDIQAVQLLFDTSIPDTSSNNSTFNQDLSIVLRGWNEKFPIEVEDASEIYSFIFNLDLASDDDKSFLPITDIDGELNFFDISEIVYVEVGINIVNEGREPYDE